MKKYLTYAIAAFFASTLLALAAPPDAATMEAKEKSVWQAVKDKKMDDFKNFLADNFVAVYSDGVYDKAHEVETVAKIDTKSFAMSDFKLTTTDPDTAIVTYMCKIESTVDGKDVSGDYNCASIWQMKNGKWQAVFHTDMKAESPGTDAQKKE